jgi:hypothetical protein
MQQATPQQLGEGIAFSSDEIRPVCSVREMLHADRH